MNKRRKNLLYFKVVIVFLILNIFLFIYNSFTYDLSVKNYEEEEFFRIDNEILANAAIIYNIDKDEIILGKNEKSLFSIASITKLISAYVISDYIDEDDESIIMEEDFELYGNTNLVLNDRWNSKELLKFSLITSSNRGISAVGRGVEEKNDSLIVDLMNQFASENNLVQTHFVNSTGLDAHSTLSGSESSALDLAKFAGILLTTKDKLVNITNQKRIDFYSLNGRKYTANNTNKLLGKIEEKILFSKTGFTDISGGTLIMAVENEKKEKIVFVILNSTKHGRFDDMEILMDLYNNKLKNA